MNVSEEDLLEMGSRVLLTMVGGESIYTNPASISRHSTAELRRQAQPTSPARERSHAALFTDCF